MKLIRRITALLLALVLLCAAASALAAKKAKPTATPEPLEISKDPVDPPEEIQRLLEIVYNEWKTVNGK